MKFVLFCFVFHLLYSFLFCEVIQKNFCSFLNETSEHHLLCKNGFNFPINLENFEENIKIKKLSIHSENLTDLKNDDFKELSALTYLDLSKSNLQNIDQDSFVNLKHLKIVNLSHNKDLKIPNEGPLFFSKSIRELIIKDVGIKNLPDDIFKEMPDLEILNLEKNEIEDIEKALENTSSLKKLILSKSNTDLLLLCERTSLKMIQTISYNDKNEKISDTLDCVTNENETKNLDVKKSEGDENNEETTTILSNDNDLHKDFCLDEKNFKFNGIMECNDEDDSKICQLSCPEGMEPNIEFENPYKCLYSTGVITSIIPKCLQNSNNSNVDAKTELFQTTTEKEMIEVLIKTAEPKIENKSEENQVDDKEKEENEENKTIRNEKENVIDQFNEKNRYLDSTPQNSMNLTDDEQNLLDGQVGESKPGTEEGINGSSVVLGIIIVVLVLGGMGMGYKYWKNHRGYHNTRTEDVEEGKEMKTINSANKTLVSDQNNE